MSALQAWPTALSQHEREAERRLGRYLTAPELEKVAQESSSAHPELAEQELRALKRIWPGMQLEFKLTDRRIVTGGK